MKPDFARVLSATMKKADQAAYGVKSNMCKPVGTSMKPFFGNQNHHPNVMKYLEDIKKYGD